MDANGGSHEHVLGSFDNFAIHFEKVAALQGLKSKEVIVVVTGVVDHLVDLVSIVQDDLVCLVTEQRGLSASFVFAGVQCVGRVSNVVKGGFVEVFDDDSVGEDGVVWMHDRQIGGRLCRQLIDLICGHT